MKILALALLGTVLASCAAPMALAPPTAAALAPAVDYHQHLVSAAFEPLVKLPRRDAAALLAELDSAGIEKAVVLSVGYTYGDERKGIAGPDAMTRQENDWTSSQVMLGQGRLIGFCSANPLRDAALGEIERCLALPGMKGIKLHIGNSGLSFRNPAHVERLGAMFALAQRSGVPLLVHMRPRAGDTYGSADVATFLAQLVARAPDVPVIVAHLGASSPGYADQNDEIMAAFEAAAKRGDPLMRNVYFDTSANVVEDLPPDTAAQIAGRMRGIGIEKFLYGSDLSAPGGSVAAGWRIFRQTLPLSEREVQVIATNRLPFTL